MKKKSKHFEGIEHMMCHTCNRVIENCRYAKCIKCINLVQCLECLSLGKEIDNHTFDHEFTIIEKDSAPIFAADWDFDEEIHLLNLIKLLGLGNWVDISERMDDRSPSECEFHYQNIYLRSKCAPLPIDFVFDPQPVPQPPYSIKPTDLYSADWSNIDIQKKQKGKKTRETLAEHNGYMPYRHEFEELYHKDAELLISSLSFDQNKETADSFIMKLQNLIVYNSQLTERATKTKIIEDWGIQDFELVNGPDPNLAVRRLNGTCEDQIRVDHQILPLSLYIGVDKTIEFANALHKKMMIEKRLNMANFCKNSGIKNKKEYLMLKNLNLMIKKGKIKNIEKWNETIEKYKKDGENDEKDDFCLLSKKESDFCIKNKINPQFFVAIKSLIVREYEIRRKMEKNILFNMCETNHHEIGLVYDLLLSTGIISC